MQLNVHDQPRGGKSRMLMQMCCPAPTSCNLGWAPRRFDQAMSPGHVENNSETQGEFDRQQQRGFMGNDMDRLGATVAGHADG